MRKHVTTAADAERELTDILGAEGRLYKDGVLDQHEIVPIRLETTYAEALLLLFEDSVVRPGFKVEADAVDYPCLFFKVNGLADSLVKKLHDWRASHTKTTLVYGGFHMLDREPNTAALKMARETAGGVEQIESLSYLSPVKKKQLAKAFDNALAWAKQSKIELSDEAMRATLLFDSKAIVDAFQQVKPADSNAKCLVNDSQKRSISPYGALRILFMHALGFDVIIISKNSYASIENVINQDMFDVHSVLPEVKKDAKKSDFSLVLGLVALVVVGLLAYFFLFAG